jgi:hypothetical protein
MKTFFQKWLTASGDGASDEMLMDHAKWLDAHGFKRLVLDAQVMTRTNATLTIQTADAQCGPWTTAATVNATGVVYIQAEESATNKLQRYVRWKVAATNTSWEICFWLAVELKE